MVRRRTADEDNLLTALGNQLRQLRLAQGISQEDFAAKAGFTRSYYTEIETGKRNISILNLQKIAVTLEMSLKDLLDFEQDKVS